MKYGAEFMEFKVKALNIEKREYSVILNSSDAHEMGLIPGDRVKLFSKGNSIVASIEISQSVVSQNEMGLYINTLERLKVKEGDVISIKAVSKPSSLHYIKKKLRGEKLSRDEITEIVMDIVDDALREVELTAFVISTLVYGMDMDEVEWLTRAMIDTGEKITFEKAKVVDKHSIGGVPGNKISLLVVPIIASTGLLIPKTSSRAITGAAGTADIMEVFADVEFTAEELKEITEKVGGALVWGGSTNIAPADDKIIEVEYPLSIDPKSQLLASVMAKKGSIGAEFVVIDIPVGEGSKVKDVKEGRYLAKDFVELGNRLGINIECAITYGGGPIGRAIGPALEGWEALKMLETGEGPRSLYEKAMGVAGILMEMAGLETEGKQAAERIMKSGKALEKFREIVEAQGGERTISSDDIVVGEKRYDVVADTEGYVIHLDNKKFIEIARAAGAPHDKGAGIYLHRKKGEIVKKGEKLFTIYAEKGWKLTNAIEKAREEFPLIIEGMVLERYPRYQQYQL